MTSRPARVVKREGKTASVIYERLRSDILNGTLLPGAHLSQQAIALESGTSRGPVREAMSRLQQDQLIIGIANRRFTVARFDIADLEAVLVLHLVNVAFAARASVPLLTPDDLAALDALLDELDATLNATLAGWERAYREFVLVLVNQAGERVVALVATLIDNIQRYRANLLDPFPRVHTATAGFRKIVDAAHRRDGEAAFHHYVEMFGRVSSLILAGAAPTHDAARLRLYIAALTPSAASRSS